MTKLNKKQLLIIIIPLALLTFIPLIAQATEITTCTFNKTAYNQGETGYTSVTIYNDKDDKIRVTELTAHIDYYYEGETAYIQTFYYPTTDLPIEIQQGQTEILNLPFTLPNNIAPGYTTLLVKAKTEQWNNNSETWISSEHPTYQPTLYIESPYKQQFEDQQATNDQLQEQIQELQAINTTTTNLMYLLGGTAIIFAVIMMFLLILNRKARVIPQPAV